MYRRTALPDPGVAEGDMRDIMSTWLKASQSVMNGAPAHLAAKFSCERLGMVYKAFKVSYRVKKITTYWAHKDGRKVLTHRSESADNEVLARIQREPICGNKVMKVSAKAIVRLDKQVITVFTRRNCSTKSIGVSGPSYHGAVLDPVVHYLNLVRSFMPPPSDVTTTAPLPDHYTEASPAVFYEVSDVRRWQTNAMLVANFGSCHIAVGSLKKESSMIRVHSYEPINFQAFNLSPVDRVFTAASVFDTGPAVFLNVTAACYANILEWLSLLMSKKHPRIIGSSKELKALRIMHNHSQLMHDQKHKRH